MTEKKYVGYILNLDTDVMTPYTKFERLFFDLDTYANDYGYEVEFCCYDEERVARFNVTKNYAER